MQHLHVSSIGMKEHVMLGGGGGFMKRRSFANGGWQSVIQRGRRG